jgi:hypothetical protein
MAQRREHRDFHHYGLQEGYWLRPGGVLEEIKWAYDGTAEEGNFLSFNRTADAHCRLFHLVRLDPDLRLRDVFLLMAQCPLLAEIERLNWGAEYLEEALSVDAKPHTGAYDPEGIEYLELRAQWELNTLTNELETDHRLDFHGVGFERREDRLARYPDRDGNPVVEYTKGSRTSWAIEFTPLAELLDLPLRVNPVVRVDEADYDTAQQRAGDGKITPVAEYKMALGWTLGQVLDGVLYEISFCGGPDGKAEKREELDAISTEVDAAIASDDWSRFEAWDVPEKEAGAEGDGG